MVSWQLVLFCQLFSSFFFDFLCCFSSSLCFSVSFSSPRSRRVFNLKMWKFISSFKTKKQKLGAHPFSVSLSVSLSFSLSLFLSLCLSLSLQKDILYSLFSMKFSMSSIQLHTQAELRIIVQVRSLGQVYTSTYILLLF